MITSNAKEVAQDLDKYSQEIERKLKAMVAGFAGEVALKASQNTPVASESVIERYMSSYKRRLSKYGVEIAPGFHAGAWRYTEGKPIFDPNIYVEEQVNADAKKDAKVNYRLGDTFRIGAIGFAFNELEAGSSVQAPNGIVKPTEQAVTAAFAADVKRYFDKG